MNLSPPAGRPLVVAHRGAAAAAPENSLEAIEAAVAVGADLVEFDVSPGLIVAHDAGASGPSLAEVLELLAPHPIGLHVDLKATGYEQAVLEELARRGLRERAVVSTASSSIARRVRELAPDVDVAIGYPRDRYGVSRLRWPDPLPRAGAAALRRVMPLRIPVLLAVARANVLALHHTLCSRAALAAARRRGAPVLAWTVNDPERVLALRALGVDAIVTDDPEMALATLNAP